MAKLWQLPNESWLLPPSGAIMGILNSTPDSFSDGGQFSRLDAALAHAHYLLQEGAHIIDVGGESTRPGATEVAPELERARTIPLIKALRARYPQLRISIDTRHYELAAEALEAGVDVINDVTGLRDSRMLRLCAHSDCGVVIMHMQGSPQTMQVAPSYVDVVAEVADFFKERLAMCMAAGLDASRLCFDPGIGFGKSLEHNLALIRDLNKLRPSPNSLMMMALSRKRMLGEILGDAASGRGPVPTAVMSLVSARCGADVHRVHDVASTRMSLCLGDRVWSSPDAV